MTTSGSCTLSSQSYVFDPRPAYPLLITAKRYWQLDSPHLDDATAATLVFAHGTGYHKEHWEPTIDDLCTLLDSSEQWRAGSKVAVREMWSIDAPNHGDAAVLNEETLKVGYDPFGWEEYARAIYTFLSAFGTGVDVDFTTRRLIGIGHSMGAVALALSVGYSPHLKFESFIFCELMTMHERFEGKTREILVAGSTNRRDVWPSREEAYKLLKSRPAWKAWDDRVLRIFVNHGMRPLPSADYSDKREGVTLKCTRIQETACYNDSLGRSRAYNVIGSLAKRMPVHLIYGAKRDYLPEEVVQDVINNAVGGAQNLASLSFVENAGHLVAQTNPTGLAQHIYEALSISHPRRVNTAKL